MTGSGVVWRVGHLGPPPSSVCPAPEEMRLESKVARRPAAQSGYCLPSSPLPALTLQPHSVSVPSSCPESLFNTLMLDCSFPHQNFNLHEGRELFFQWTALAKALYVPCNLLTQEEELGVRSQGGSRSNLSQVKFGESNILT